jgi:hypothetical protein
MVTLHLLSFCKKENLILILKKFVLILIFCKAPNLSSHTQVAKPLQTMQRTQRKTHYVKLHKMNHLEKPPNLVHVWVSTCVNFSNRGSKQVFKHVPLVLIWDY